MTYKKPHPILFYIACILAYVVVAWITILAYE